jgi:hypothetical protein
MRITVFLFVLSFYGAFIFAQEVKADPNLWDFGKVKEGKIVRHEFVFKNDAAVDLKIEGVTTSCGCTVSEVKQRLLKPGESTIIEASFNSAKYSGKVTQHIYVNTDNPDNPLVQFTIKADVEKMNKGG